jgi:hypothetical protein
MNGSSYPSLIAPSNSYFLTPLLIEWMNGSHHPSVITVINSIATLTHLLTMHVFYTTIKFQTQKKCMVKQVIPLPHNRLILSLSHNRGIQITHSFTLQIVLILRIVPEWKNHSNFQNLSYFEICLQQKFIKISSNYLFLKYVPFYNPLQFSKKFLFWNSFWFWKKNPIWKFVNIIKFDPFLKIHLHYKFVPDWKSITIFKFIPFLKLVPIFKNSFTLDISLSF